MHINEKAYYALQLQIVVMMELVVFEILTQNYLVVKILTTWEMYNDSDISAVDFNEFVLSFQYEADKMKVFEARSWSVVEIEVFLLLLMLIFVCRAWHGLEVNLFICFNFLLPLGSKSWSNSKYWLFQSVMPAPLTTIKLIPQQTHQQKEHLVNL